jgi:hypothetical protein
VLLNHRLVSVAIGTHQCIQQPTLLIHGARNPPSNKPSQQHEEQQQQQQQEEEEGEEWKNGKVLKL